MQQLLVDQARITQTRIADFAPAALATGQSRLRVRRFALTANNVTYAAAGFILKYWDFFPSGVEGQGLVPVWGYADVTETRSDALSVGDRLYGYFPMSAEVVLTPKGGTNGVTDISEHRADLPPVYNRYMKVPEGRAQDEALQALLQPLLATSYLLSDWLEDNTFFGAEQVIVGSASSKTGLGLLKFLAEQSPRKVQSVGLTSARNAGFVTALGAADQVVTYDAIETLGRVPSVYVDMAGNADVRARLHSHLGDLLRHSSAVGTSHWDQFRPAQELDGPKPQFFFAPAQIEKRRADWGPGVIERQIGEAWQRVAVSADSWLDIRTHHGWSAAQQVYADLASGRANPRDGHIITL